jgi:cold shock CspA family protein
MPTGTVKIIDTSSKYGVVVPDDGGGDLHVNFKDFGMTRLRRLTEGMKVSYIVVGHHEGKHEAAIRHRGFSFDFEPYVEERRIAGPDPIERTLYLHSNILLARGNVLEVYSEPIAVAYLDEPGTEAALAWRVASDVSLEPVLEVCFEDFLPRYSGPAAETAVEFWLGDHFFEESIGSKPNAEQVMKVLGNSRALDHGALGLLQISSDRTAIEFMFEAPGENVARIGLLISTVRVGPLTHLFSKFHQNPVVRQDSDISALAFGLERRMYRRRPRLLDPLPVVRGE